MFESVIINEKNEDKFVIKKLNKIIPIMYSTKAIYRSELIKVSDI